VDEPRRETSVTVFIFGTVREEEEEATNIKLSIWTAKRQNCFLIDNNFVRETVTRAAYLKNGVFWDVTPCGSCKNQHFGGT
jgi:hypothetical protein